MKRWFDCLGTVLFVGSAVFVVDPAPAVSCFSPAICCRRTGTCCESHYQRRESTDSWDYRQCTVSGTARILGEFCSGKKHDNLDEFWGCANLGAKCKAKGFSSEVNIRAFPEGWGYEPLTGLSIKDFTDTLSLSTSKTSIAKFQIEQAWVKYDRDFNFQEG